MRRRRPSTLRTRLTLAVAAVVFLSVVVSMLVGVLLVRRSVEGSALRQLDHEAALLATREKAYKQSTDLGLFLVARGEHLNVLSRQQASLLLPAKSAAQLADGRAAHGQLSLHGTRYLFSAQPSGSKAIVLLRQQSLDAQDWHPFGVSLLIAGGVGFLLATLVAAWLARSVARPVREVADAARGLAAKERPEPVPRRGSRELVTLADSFNRLADELESAEAAERQFLLSVSHELKTPLTAIRGHAEGLIEALVEPTTAGSVIEHESRRLERLVSDLLDLARLHQSRFQIRSEPIDLVELAYEALLRHGREAEEFGVKLRVAASEDEAAAYADGDRVLQVLSNLVENALRVTPDGGQVVIGVVGSRLTVADSGPGLAADDLQRAFERFFLYNRYADARPVGTGLGLAIVKELTEAMAGSVSIASSPGQGTTFTIELPAAAPSR